MNINEYNYRKTINVDYDYKITIKQFTKWLKKNPAAQAELWETLEKIQKLSVEDLYFIALDYKIPIIMVKYLWAI